MGDIELLCGLAPFEVGNRLWIETDGDECKTRWGGPFPFAHAALASRAGPSPVKNPRWRCIVMGVRWRGEPSHLP